MFDVNNIVATICKQTPNNLIFEPIDVQLSDIVVATTKADEEASRFVNLNESICPPISSFQPQNPLEHNVLAIDSTSAVLGYVPEGLVGAIRASVIVKPEGKTHHQMQRYGPYLVVVTNYSKDDLYRSMCGLVYGQATPARAPDCRKTLDRIRNLLERYLQFQAVNTYADSLVLIDGSLMAGAVADPMFVIKKLIQDSHQNRNTLVALSKSTTLTLRESHLSIFSLVGGVTGVCYVGDLCKYLSQQQDRYMGCIYVARLSPQGEAFRFDIPENAALQHAAIFPVLSGLSGEHGYPEELKLAHMTSVLSSIEVIELQAAAINLHGLVMKENVRRKLFPM
jgi:hypothetical protein